MATNTAKILQKIQVDPQGTLNKQNEVSSEATSFILAALLRQQRRMQGVMNKSDEVEQNSQIVRALNYISEHDPLFFLTLIQRFDLIREIFRDKEQYAQRLAIIKEIEKEHEEEKFQQTLFLTQEQNKLIQKQHEFQQAALNAPTANTLLNNMELLRYYEMEYQHLCHQYHGKQIKIYEQAFDDRITRMDKAIDLARSDPSFTAEDIHEFETLRANYEAEKRVIEQMVVAHPDGKPDLVALERQHNAYKTMDWKYGAQFDLLLTKHANNPGMLALHTEERLSTQFYRSELKVNEQVFVAQEKEFKSHLNEVRQASKEEIEQGLDGVIKTLRKVGGERLDDEQKQSLDDVLVQLETHQQELKTAANAEDIQKILSKSTAELEKIEKIIKPVVSDELFKQFKKGQAVLNSAVIAPIVIQENNRSYQSALQADAPLVLKAPSEPSFFKAQLPEVGDNVSSSNTPIINSVMPVQKEEQQLQKSEPAHIATQRNFKSALQEEKKLGVEKVISVDRNENKIRTALDNLERDIGKVIKRGAIEPEDLKLILEIMVQIQKIKQGDDFPAAPTELTDSLEHNLNEISQRNEEFSEIKEGFEPTLAIIEEPISYHMNP